MAQTAEESFRKTNNGCLARFYLRWRPWRSLSRRWLPPPLPLPRSRWCARLPASSQFASITNTQSIRPNSSVAEVFGFIREKIYSTIGQPFTPQLVGINAFGSNVFPGITIVDDLGNFAPQILGDVRPLDRVVPSTRA